MYYLLGSSYLFVDGNFSANFTEETTECYYQQYLAWVAEGNVAEEWTD